MSAKKPRKMPMPRKFNHSALSKSAILQRRHMLDANRSTICENWGAVCKHQDPVWIMADARSNIGQALAISTGQLAELKRIEQSGSIPTVHITFERAEAISLMSEAGYNMDTLLKGIPGLTVPVIVIDQHNGLMTSMAGAPGVQVQSRQAAEDAYSASVDN